MIKYGVDEQKVQRKNVNQRQTFPECWLEKNTFFGYSKQSYMPEI